MDDSVHQEAKVFHTITTTQVHLVKKKISEAKRVASSKLDESLHYVLI